MTGTDHKGTASAIAPSATLAGNSLLAGAPPGEFAELDRRARFLAVEAGAEILTRDSPSRDVFFVLKGRVRIVNYSTSGREIAFAVAGAGDWFGELSAIDGLPRSATVVALERCQLASLDPESFRALLLRVPAVALRVMEKLVRIVRACDEKIMDLATLSAYQRVYNEILRLAKPDPVRSDSWLIYPLPTQAQIASHASTTRETVARVLGQLAQAGIAERKSKTLYLRDRAKLALLAERTAPNAASHS